MQETLVNYHALSKNISVLRHTRSQGQGQVVDFITFYSTSECFRTLASYKSSKRTHFKAKLDAKGQFFNKIYC